MRSQNLVELIERARWSAMTDMDRRLQSESFARHNVSDDRQTLIAFMRDYRHAYTGRLLPDVRR